MNPASLLLCIGVQAALRDSLRPLGFDARDVVAGPEAASLGEGSEAQAVLLEAPSVDAMQRLVDNPSLPRSALERAWVVCTGYEDSTLAAAQLELELLRRGVEAILPLAGIAPHALARQLNHALERKRLERAARTAYATDLATGLPHQAQLIEHMTQLLALREREPAPMVLLVLRVDGFAQAAARLGAEAGNVLRRKVAVRLRSGLRASDVVAALGPDAFGVLLGRLEAKSDGERVAGKLLRALQQPIQVAGQACTVGVSVGLALYPDHGKDADTLIKRASAQAGSVATLGQEGFASHTHRAGAAAANDPGP